MKKTAHLISEGALFLAGVTLLGGFLDAYTYITRGGVFANNHTGNMAKLGIELANGHWHGAFSCFVPMLACVLGAAASEWTKHHSDKNQDWRKNALLAELIALVAAAFLPAAVPNGIVNAAFSFITGFQLCLFRTGPWGAHNTTICTGNLRTVGQFLYGAIREKRGAEWSKLLQYACVVFSFALGAGVGVPLCKALGTSASMAGAVIAAILLAALIHEDRQILAVCVPAELREKKEEK